MTDRPFGVALIAILIGIDAILQLLAALAFFGVSSVGFFSTSYVGPAAVLMMLGILMLLVGIVEMIVAVSMWHLEKWTWMLAVIIAWISVVFDFIAAFVGTQTWGMALVSMIVPVIVLFYMYMSNVQKAFGR